MATIACKVFTLSSNVFNYQYVGLNGDAICKEGQWVLRDPNGREIDRDTYRYDLAERNNIILRDE